MPFLVQGSADQVIHAFGQDWMTERQHTTNTHIVERDLTGILFLGSVEQAQTHLKAWRAQPNPEYYIQGNMTAGNLYLLLGQLQPLIKKGEGEEAWIKQYVRTDFAYVSDKQELCGLMMCLRRDDPSQWVMGIIKNTNGLPKDRKVILLSSFDLAHHLRVPVPGIEEVEVSAQNNALLDQVDSALIKELLIKTFKAKNSAVDIRFERIIHLLKFLQIENQNQLIDDPVLVEKFNLAAIFKENPVWDLIALLGLRLSSRLLNECASDDSQFIAALNSMPTSTDPQRQRGLYEKGILFYEAGLFKEFSALVQNTELLKAMDKVLHQPQGKEVLVILLKGKYEPNLLKQILSEPAYYKAVCQLERAGLAEDVPAFFTQRRKLETLKYIGSIENETHKKLCLIFWIKGELTTEELVPVVAALTQYPLLAEMLLNLEAKGEHSIKELSLLAQDPARHLQKTMMLQFANEFAENGVALSHLKGLTQAELADLRVSYRVLSDAKITPPHNFLDDILNNVTIGAPQNAYVFAAEKSARGQLLRLFLPQLAQVADLETRVVLIKFLYHGIKADGVMAQITALKEIPKNTPLAALAEDLLERYSCAKQMCALNFKDEVIAFAAEKEAIKSKRFREIIRKVEAQCEGVHERLRKSNFDRVRIKDWQEADKVYRKTLYGLAYEELTTGPNPNLKARIKEAEEKVLAIVDPEIASWLLKTLVVIANILITGLSFGLANVYKENQTGNFWFFTQTESGEQLRKLDQEVQGLVKESAQPQ